MAASTEGSGSVGTVDDANPRGRRAGLPTARYTPRALLAFAPSVSQLVSMAGGLLCDRALAGWTVTTIVGREDIDATPLKILGVDFCLSIVDVEFDTKMLPQTVVASTMSLTSEAAGEANWLAPYDIREAELYFYGEPSTDQALCCSRIEYQVSSASRAFKAHALVAAGAATHTSDSVEAFFHSPAPSTARPRGVHMPQ